MVFDFVLFNNKNHIIQCVEYDLSLLIFLVENYQQKRDQRKEDWCKKNNIPLVRIPYYDFDKIDKEYLFARFPKLK